MKYSGVVLKVCSAAVMTLVVIAALGPANLLPRTGLWQLEHLVGYFAVTLIVCLAWPRPFMVGGTLMAVAVALEALQALTPDRSANLIAALLGAGGVLAAVLVAEVFMRIRRRLQAEHAPLQSPTVLRRMERPR
jgi:VanZ family protein